MCLTAPAGNVAIAAIEVHGGRGGMWEAWTQWRSVSSKRSFHVHVLKGVMAGALQWNGNCRSQLYLTLSPDVEKGYATINRGE